MNVKKIGAGVALAGAMTAAAVGVGAGVANADQQAPAPQGVTWKLDRPDWDDWYDDDDRRGPRWDGPRYDYGYGRGGACAWVPPAVSQWIPPAAC